jgi:hypothetical protein
VTDTPSDDQDIFADLVVIHHLVIRHRVIFGGNFLEEKCML